MEDDAALKSVGGHHILKSAQSDFALMGNSISLSSFSCCFCVKCLGCCSCCCLLHHAFVEDLVQTPFQVECEQSRGCGNRHCPWVGGGQTETGIGEDWKGVAQNVDIPAVRNT